MKHIRKIAFCLALMLALTGMGGVAYAENETAAICGGSTDPPEAVAEAPPEEGEEITEEAAETVTASPEAVSGEDPPAEDAAEEPNAEPAEETDAPEAENAAEEAPAPQFTAVEAPAAEPTLTQISVTWSEDPVEFIVSDAQRWNAEDLCWETDPERNGEISIAEGSNGKTFTVANESGEALAASVTFTPDESLPEALKNAYAGVSCACDPIPAGETVRGTATVNFDFTAMRLTDDTLTGGTLGSFTLCLTPEVGYEEAGNDPENPE